MLVADGLVLEPQTAAHAPEMFRVLRDPAIYEHENAPPRSLEWLTERYARLETRASADGRERWLNWVIRLSSSAELIGYVQATVHPDGRAAIAYELASAHWGRGYARRAVQAMIDELVLHDRVTRLTAVGKRANLRSRRFLEKLGFMEGRDALRAAYEVETDEWLLLRDEQGFHLRVATPDDIAQLQALIARSGNELSAGFYTPEQAAAITTHIFGVDTQLIADRTYFAVEDDAGIVACGGWSKRRTLFGGDQAKSGPDPLLDPATEPARIRAFFVDPAMARRGLGRLLMTHCTRQAVAAGFRSLALVSTMPGEPLYRASGFTVTERFELSLPGPIQVPVARMVKPLSGVATAREETLESGPE
jgi:RimJ/RimL family protein N-acetyltransferase